jgi:hypothetical protein
MNLATTTITLPPIALRSRCAICQLWHADPALFDDLNEKLLGGFGQTKLLAWLKTKGFRTNQTSLSRHKNKHLQPYFNDAIEILQTARAIATTTGGMENITLAGVILRVLAAKVHDAVSDITPGNIGKLDTLDLMKMATKLAEAIAMADRTAADSALKAEELELRKLRLAKSKEELAALAVDWLRKELAGRPDLVEHLREQLALPVPAGAESEPDSSVAPPPQNDKPKARPRKKAHA